LITAKRWVQSERRRLEAIRMLEGTAGPQRALAGEGQQTFLDVDAATRRSLLKIIKITPLPKP